jgi:hypothetical protein
MTPSSTLDYSRRNILKSMNEISALLKIFYSTLRNLIKKYPIVSKISITYGATIEINSALVHIFIA